VCVRHTFCQLAYRSDPSTDFTVDSLKDADLRKDVLLGVSMMNNHIYGFKVPQNPHFGGLNRSLKVIQTSTVRKLGAVSYLPSIVTMALSCIVSEIKRDIGQKS